ncbi:MAG: hypothetical protein AB7K09_00560 [Planctomycetota bacterium]
MQRTTRLAAMWMLALLASFVLPAAVAFANDDDDSNQLETRATIGLNGMAERLKQAYPEVRAFVRARIGLWYDGHVICIIARDLAELRAHFASLGMAGVRVTDTLAGIAFPSRGIIALNLSAHRNGPMVEEVLRTLRHEYCHLAIGQGLRDTELQFPLWFEEGICQWVQSAGWMPNDTALAATEGRIALPSLDDLSERIAARDTDTPAAYALSEDAAGFLMSGVPVEERNVRVQQLCDAWRKGGSFADAFEQVFGEPLAAFETRWRAHRQVGGWESVGWFIAHHQVELMFGGCAVLMLLAVWFRRLARRRWDRQYDAAVKAGLEPPDDADDGDGDWTPSMADPEAAKRALKQQRRR